MINFLAQSSGGVHSGRLRHGEPAQQDLRQGCGENRLQTQMDLPFREGVILI